MTNTEYYPEPEAFSQDWEELQETQEFDRQDCMDDCHEEEG